ncbi:MAG: hypothetical protein GY717_14440 [Rhodobacteraceae bacterium]|nr:hypothetical protein [Paracoccaceae bacterium]
MRFFTIPVFAGDEATAELDRFLASHRILGTDRQFVQDGVNSAWCLCVSYLEAGDRPAPVKRGRVDYKELLSEHDFAIYSRLRDLRKRLAEQQGVPAYALFTNEQLAAMVKQRVSTRSQLQAISGVGEGRAEKYGQAFLSQLQQARTELPAPVPGKNSET